ncbi:hypothetical protein [uncultured Kriegella sp.]|uniref:hypothetical protein n=1 Tax=uncultured Kriegella sp. TaxID=1798910 RepID=UPI0030DAF3C7|tara:strand:- start:328971 stop:329294 length:324 start_codon:yes stop_codon:yes gene_type:complete
MKEYNGTRVSFLTQAGKRLVSMTQKINAIISLINNQDSFAYDFTDAVERFQSKNYSDLEGFCCDETLSYHLLLKDRSEDTPENREMYYLALRNHLLSLGNIHLAKDY